MDKAPVNLPREARPALNDVVDDSDIDQIRERLSWSPKQRLDYLLDMLAFEDRAHRARRLS
jgi:hypothetical protein